MSTPELICAKLDTLVAYLQELREYTKGLTLEAYLRDRRTRRAVERIIQLVVECATDINNMVIKLEGGKVPSDYFNSFIELAELDVIPIEFALDIGPSTGLRNVLVHEYSKIDDVQVYKSIEQIFAFYPKFVHLVSKHLGC
jgi:uncharacterized protein YutE (UPF0331/DUF86 family)